MISPTCRRRVELPSRPSVPSQGGAFLCPSVEAEGACVAVDDWSEEQDYREGWGDVTRASRQQRDREFCFREAGVARFNDVVDDGYEESGHES